MTDSKILGRKGEKLAARTLKRNGYKILEKNFCSINGEIDIVAKDDGVLVFVEVKTRQHEKFGSPLEAVTPTKQNKVTQVAKSYLLQHRLRDVPVRFDVIGIDFTSGKPKIQLVKSAFDAKE